MPFSRSTKRGHSMVDVRHKSLPEVRQTIRAEIAQEQQYLDSLAKRSGSIVQTEKTKTQAIITAYRNTLMWLSDLEQ